MNQMGDFIGSRYMHFPMSSVGPNISFLNSRLAGTYSGAWCWDEKSGAKGSAFFVRLNQYILAWSQVGKCTLKCVMSPNSLVGLPVINICIWEAYGSKRRRQRKRWFSSEMSMNRMPTPWVSIHATSEVTSRGKRSGGLIAIQKISSLGGGFEHWT